MAGFAPLRFVPTSVVRLKSDPRSSASLKSSSAKSPLGPVSACLKSTARVSALMFSISASLPPKSFQFPFNLHEFEKPFIRFFLYLPTLFRRVRRLPPPVPPPSRSHPLRRLSLVRAARIRAFSAASNVCFYFRRLLGRRIQRRPACPLRHGSAHRPVSFPHTFPAPCPAPSVRILPNP